MTGRAAAAVAGALVVAVAVPGVAGAAKRTVYVGQFGDVPAGTPETAQLNQFYPGKVRVRKGDKLVYRNESFHTVSVLGDGDVVPPPAIEDPAGGTYQGVLDPQGNPFFFNGAPKFLYNEEHFLPVRSGKGGAKVGDGRTHSSGVFTPSEKGPGEFKLKFTRKGSYKVLCYLHPGMRQKVKVGGRRGKRDSKTRIQSRALKQVGRDWGRLRDAANKEPGNARTVLVGTESGQSALLDYFPDDLTVPANTAVDFVMDSPSEIHNMVFLGANDAAKDYARSHQEQHDLFPVFAPANQLAPGYVFGTEPGRQIADPFTYSGDEYGNGFLWTPLQDADAASPLPEVVSIVFDTPGTFNYYCAIHGDGMSGSITVQ